MDMDNKTLWNDYRIAQPLNTRVVESSFLPRLGKGCMYNVVTQQEIMIYTEQCQSPSLIVILCCSLAFCRQDEIESKLLKIEGLITSLGKHMISGDWTLND